MPSAHTSVGAAICARESHGSEGRGRISKKKKSNFLTKRFDKFFQGFLSFYSETLGFWLNRKKTIIGTIGT